VTEKENPAVALNRLLEEVAVARKPTAAPCNEIAEIIFGVRNDEGTLQDLLTALQMHIVQRSKWEVPWRKQWRTAIYKMVLSNIRAALGRLEALPDSPMGMELTRFEEDVLSLFVNMWPSNVEKCFAYVREETNSSITRADVLRTIDKFEAIGFIVLIEDTPERGKVWNGTDLGKRKMDKILENQ
jgi:hypothetical protein